MGRPWGQAVECSVLARASRLSDLGGFEGLVDPDRRVAGDAGGDAAAAGFQSFRSGGCSPGDGEELFDHGFELAAFEATRGGLDGEGAGAEGFGFEAVVFELFGDLGEGDHLGWEKVDEERHQ